MTWTYRGRADILVRMRTRPSSILVHHPRTPPGDGVRPTRRSAACPGAPAPAGSSLQHPCPASAAARPEATSCAGLEAGCPTSPVLPSGQRSSMEPGPERGLRAPANAGPRQGCAAQAPGRPPPVNGGSCRSTQFRRRLVLVSRSCVWRITTAAALRSPLSRQVGTSCTAPDSCRPHLRWPLPTGDSERDREGVALTPLGSLDVRPRSAV